MRYISLFSGIEAASVAWGPLVWEPVAFSEIEPFCCDLLAQRFPDVPNLGDVSGVDWTKYEGMVDVVIGGSPCQAFSLAGKRKGLLDERGLLMLEYVRAVREVRPRWVLWENVPGVLSQDRGRAFGTLLGELADLGCSLAWRVLDAQFYGVAQRRRRVFLVGHPLPGCAAAVLFDPESLRWDPATSREKRQALAEAAGRGSAQGGGALGFCPGVSVTGSLTFCDNYSPTIRAQDNINTPAVCVTQYGEECAGTLTARHDSSPCADRGQNVVVMQASNGEDVVGALCARDHKGVGSEYVGECKVLCMASGQANAEITEDGSAPTLTTLHEPPIMLKVRCGNGHWIKADGSVGTAVGGTLTSEDLAFTLATTQDQTMFQPDEGGWVVRRLMPVECERLQGFPDGWTDLGGTPDSSRYKALGNSMAVPVIRWLGENVERVERVTA
ncbi:MAG: DNA cytosine methyltransferase [Atopobiaceae bacterium]|nr:DNA cytosine methyltransferase [Atopobiaceae bacterium]